MKKRNKNKKDNWLWQVFIITFCLAIAFGTISNTVVTKLNMVIATILLFVIILIGILFDLVGMAVASATEAPFHAKAAKKHKGAKEAIRLIRNSPKVSNICNDVIGDICGIISGSIGALLSINISSKFNLDMVIVSLIVSAIIASLTVGGKALGKKFAIKKCTNIIYFAGATIHYVCPIKQNKKKTT